MTQRSRSSIRQLRDIDRPDYRKMSQGEIVIAGEPGAIEEAEGAVAGGAFPIMSDSVEDEISKLREEMKKLDEEEDKLTKTKELETLRRQLAAKKERVRTLRGMAFEEPLTAKSGDIVGKGKTKVDVSEAKTDINVKLQRDKAEKVLDEAIDIDTLRKDEKLKLRAKKEMLKLCLISESESESSLETADSDSYFDSTDESEKVKYKSKKNKSKSKKHRSGINAKAADRVEFPQKWPQAFLHHEHVSKQVKFEQLDFKLFIAGELEIISEEDLTKSELEGRLSLLKKIVYYSSTYEFEGLKKFYASWVREIEVGRKKWSDDPSSWESAFLSKYIIKSNKQFTPGRKEKVSNNDERVWFCSAYQRNKCAHKSNHMLVIKGKMRLASHICASCWQKDKKKLEHPESSSCCPHASV